VVIVTNLEIAHRINSSGFAVKGPQSFSTQRADVKVLSGACQTSATL
jgi:hypothetical protein